VTEAFRRCVAAEVGQCERTRVHNGTSDMARIGILMLWEWGHHMPTFNLARQLSARGHDVTYFTIPALSELVRSYGFGQQTILSDVFGPCAEQVQRFPVRRVMGNRRRMLLKSLARGPLANEVMAFRPDLLLLDQLLAGAIGTSLQRRGMPFVLLNTSLPNERDRRLAPITSALYPSRSIWSRLLIDGLWSAVFLRNWFRYIIRIDLAPIRPALRRSWTELVLCGKQFDFPRPDRPNRYYIGPSVALQRPPQAFAFDRLPTHSRLVYCSLGTQAHRYKRRLELLRRVASVAARMSNVHFVVVADGAALERLKGLPTNITAVNTAPQLALLGRAAVAITHGGLGTIKECILSGVPMLVLPQAFDQHGNAARVEYHGLGLRAVHLPSVGRIHVLLEELLSRESYRKNVQRMSLVFEREQNDGRGASLVLQHLARARLRK